MKHRKQLDPPKSDRFLEVFRRITIPEILHPADVALVLGIDAGLAARLMESGEFGPTIRWAGRLMVWRVSFFSALRRHEIKPPTHEDKAPDQADTAKRGPA